MTPREHASENATESDRPRGDRGGLDQPTGLHTVPDFEAARTHVLTELVRFTDELRQAGVDVPATGTLEGARALAVVGFADREPAGDALRAALLSEAADREAFDEAFPPFWHRLRTGIDRIATHEGTSTSDDDEPEPAGSVALEGEASELLSETEPPSLEGDDGDGSERAEVRLQTGRRHATGERPIDEDEDGDAVRRYSAVGGRERVAATPASLTDAERDAIDRFVNALATVPGRRTQQATAGERIDARRALRSSLGTGGTPMDLPTRDPVPSELHCCLLIDVSGSVLDTVDRDTLLAVAERLQTVARRSSVFLFDTDLVDATEQFERAGGDPAAALRAAEISWGGGTQIGDAFETLRRQHRDAVDRRTVVIVISDGLDVGEQSVLEEQITWLARRAAAVLWLNPLAVASTYEPRTRGMETCLPYVDGLFGFAEPTDLAEIARQLERRGLDGPIGYEYDPRRQQPAEPTPKSGEGHE
ncbi:vWA domain-containing protein [Natronorubrum sulfidifaciens]|uniref:VWA containing CoxE-like protein n=1 Tax=Natronorubrum sulfidifaciens JCM 14089 TaxID=1230460 RepID=L9W312_9EURY|nr:VWA domain-containing protein [Natronorubrum sulfidifaciens]ELY43874.1 VWA containing CoxE-like protein [Natronorubrum sulfidifaciens JCM 14089]